MNILFDSSDQNDNVYVCVCLADSASRFKLNGAKCFYLTVSN